MPSDALIQAALDATASEREAFLSAVRSAADELEGKLRAARVRGQGMAARVSEELGSFAVGRIDPEKLAAFEPKTPELHPTAFEALDRAARVLREIARLDEDGFVVEVEDGRSLYDAVTRRLSKMGRAFGAAELVAVARGGSLASVDTDRKLERYHPDRWNARERELAPPLVIVTPGSALRISALRDWLEGGQRFVFLVEGDCPPAPLAGLLTPGAWVGQIAAEEGLEAFKASDGPAACAVVPDGAARFRHEPGRGLIIDAEVSEDSMRTLGAVTAWRQREDLRTLMRFAGVAVPVTEGAAPSSNGAPPAVEPADRLAAWLLEQADVPAED